MYPLELKLKLLDIFGDNHEFVKALKSDDANAIMYLDLNDFDKDGEKLDTYVQLLKFVIDDVLVEPPKKSKKRKKEIYSELISDDDKSEDKNSENSNDDKEKDDDELQQKNRDSNENESDKSSESNSSENKKNEDSESKDGEVSDTNVIDKIKSLFSPKKKKQNKKGNKSKQKKQNSQSKQDNQNNQQQENQDNQHQDNSNDQNQQEESYDKMSRDEKIEKLNDLKNMALDAMFLQDLMRNQSMPEKEFEQTTDEKSSSSQDWERHSLTTLGGRKYSDIEAKKVIRDWIVWISQSGLYHKQRGYLYNDKKRIAKHIITDQTWKIKDDKMDKAYGKILFLLDFSGSCSWISKTFAQIGKIALEFPNVTVAYGGYEGYIQGFITKNTDIDKVNAYYSESKSIREELSLSDYLKKHNDIKSIIILGDYDGTPRYVDAYNNHYRDKKFIWFNCEEYSFYRYDNSDMGGLKKCMYNFDGSIEQLAHLTKYLKKRNI